MGYPGCRSQSAASCGNLLQRSQVSLVSQAMASLFQHGKGTCSPGTLGSTPYHGTARLSRVLRTGLKMYRPGDTAHYSGVLRRDRSGSYELPEPDSSVVLNLRGPSGEVVLAATTSISSSGVFSGTLRSREMGHWVTTRCS